MPARAFSNIANPLPDALISLKTLPGVFSGNYQSTFYNVRGGNYDENLWRPSILLSIKTGLRFTRWDFNNENILMPRLSLAWHLNDRTNLVFAVGRYAQPPLYKEIRNLALERADEIRSQKSTRGKISTMIPRVGFPDLPM